jgi:hypothetical protein
MALTLNIKQLSVEINLAIKTIRTTMVRNPTALPPRLIIQGQKKLIWLRSDVEEFYQRQLRGHGSNPSFSTAAPLKQPESGISNSGRKRGRPTKAQQLQSQNGNSKC